MNKQVEYFVVEKSSHVGLMFEVTNLLKEGWQTVGGVSVVKYDVRSVMFYQAMVRYDGTF